MEKISRIWNVITKNILNRKGRVKTFIFLKSSGFVDFKNLFDHMKRNYQKIVPKKNIRNKRISLITSFPKTCFFEISDYHSESAIFYNIRLNKINHIWYDFHEQLRPPDIDVLYYCSWSQNKQSGNNLAKFYICMISGGEQYASGQPVSVIIYSTLDMFWAAYWKRFLYFSSALWQRASIGEIWMVAEGPISIRIRSNN